MMEEQDLKQWTKQFALRVIRVVEALPKGKTADVLGRQLLRCGTSVGAIDFHILNFTRPEGGGCIVIRRRPITL